MKKKKNKNGFSLVEITVCMIIIGVLSVFILPKFSSSNSASQARSGMIVQLVTKINLGVQSVKGQSVSEATNFAGGPGFVTIDKNIKVRVVNGFPDRWCDGVGLLTGVVSNNNCYNSTIPVPIGDFVFYGYGNKQILNGNAGWRIESAPDPVNCSVGYQYNGSGIPVVIPYTSGC